MQIVVFHVILNNSRQSFHRSIKCDLKKSMIDSVTDQLSVSHVPKQYREIWLDIIGSLNYQDGVFY